MAVLSDEQVMLRDSARAWVSERAPVSAFRTQRAKRAAIDHDPAVWRDMADMGWTGVLVPEAHGGSAFGHLSLGLILEELGRTLAPSPLLGTTMGGASALVLGGTADQQARWLRGVADGTVLVAIAVDEGPHHAPERIAMAARSDGNGWVLDGVKQPVLDGNAATLVIVAARTSGAPGDTTGITLFVVPADTPGLSVQPLNRIDARDAAVLEFAAVWLGADAILGNFDNGGPLLEAVLDRLRAGLAAEMLGTATQAFETTLEYLKTRVQFGKPIGAFQALQHRAVDLLAELELTRSAVEAALTAIDTDAPPADIAELTSLAKMLAIETLRRAANEMVQMHGGIGMTEEHDAGLYLKRSRAAAVAFGDLSYHRERFGRLTGH